MEFLQNIVQIYAPILIAISAIVFTIWQVNVTKTHNKKSVIPQLDIEENTNPNKDNKIGLYIRNKGLGPAVIKKIIFFVDEKEYVMKTRNDYINMSKLLQIQSPICSYGGFHKHTWLSSNEKRYIFEIDLNNTNSIPLIQSFEKQLTKLSISIEYESVYGDKFILQIGKKFSKSLGLSSRNEST